MSTLRPATACSGCASDHRITFAIQRPSETQVLHAGKELRVVLGIDAVSCDIMNGHTLHTVRCV